MNWKELFEKYDNTRRVYDLFTSRFNRDYLLEHARIVVDTELELENLGENLEFSDFEKVKELALKREESLELFFQMSFRESKIDRRSSPKERLEWEKEKWRQFDEAIKGNVDF